MRRKMPVNRRWLLTIVIVAALLAGLLAALAPGGDNDDPPPRAEYLNLDDSLKEVAWAYDAWLASGRPESSAPFNLDWEVGVFVWISSNRSGILDFLEENKVYNIEGSHRGQSNTLAFVPVPVLSPLARQPGVEWAFMMFPPEPPVNMEPPLAPTWTPAPTRPESLVRGSSGFTPPPPPTQEYPKMSNTMSHYVDRYERGEITEADAVIGIGESMAGPPYVFILVYGEDPEGMQEALETNGVAADSRTEPDCYQGQPVATCLIYATVHLNSLVSLSQHESIETIRRQTSIAGVSGYAD